MKLPWILAAVGIGAAAYIIANTPGHEYATGSDSVEDAARSTSEWGSKTRLKGAGAGIAGKIKEGVGKVTGNQDLAARGVGDQVAGSIANAVGSVAQAAGQTIHDLNR